MNALRTRLMRGAHSEPSRATRKKSLSNKRLLWGADSQGSLFPVHKPVLLAHATLSPHSRERRIAVQIEFFSQYSAKEHEQKPVSSIEYAQEVCEILANSSPPMPRVGMFSGGGLV